MSSKTKVVAVVGPTASGKTSLAIEIAKHFSGEVISADSRQVYKALDIGTGKVTTEEMQGVMHHLLDIVEPSEVYTANHFVRDATAVISRLVAQQRLPVIAGGTFFYIDLLRGKMQSAPVEPNTTFRESLERYTNDELLELLRSKDGKRAETIDPNNRRRLVRALEIIETLGAVPKPIASESDYEWLLIGLEVPKAELREKFGRRLDAWIEQGLLAEVENVRQHVSKERFLELGFEYSLVADYLDKKITDTELKEKFVQKNWQYAKRQLTWLKRDAEIEWFLPANREAIFERVDRFLQEQ